MSEKRRDARLSRCFDYADLALQEQRHRGNDRGTRFFAFSCVRRLTHGIGNRSARNFSGLLPNRFTERLELPLVVKRRVLAQRCN